MSKMAETVNVALAPAEAVAAVEAAVRGAGLNVKSSSASLVEATEGVGLTRMPSKIEIHIGPGTANSTPVELRGQIYGIGPIQKMHLRKIMEGIKAGLPG